MDTVIKIQNLSVQREVPILRNIDWEIRRGENWVILGANGSGKTSLLATLTAYLSPTAGAIEVLGSVYGKSDWRELRKKIGLVSTAISQRIRGEELAWHTVLSGQEAMINFWGQIPPEGEKNARQILKDLGCEYLADRPWVYLSQGERQRVLIGRALMARYAVLILDEPCAGLDLVARENFLSFLNSLVKKPAAPVILLVTHHVEEITPAFTHIIMLKEGKVLTSGKKETVLTEANLSQTFSAKIRLESANQRYWARPEHN